MTDRYENIRKALEMGPTPGPWAVNPAVAQVDAMPSALPVCKLLWPTARRTEAETWANGQLIAACDPDTIRELLAERDALARENEAMRRCAIKYLSWLDVVRKPLDEVLREDMANPDMCGDAAIAAANGGGND